MATIKVHLQRIRRGPWGGTINGSLCNRFACTVGGMNLTDKTEEVTCLYCLRLIERRAA